MEPTLFAGLPEQRAPQFRESDEHWIIKCERCYGTGIYKSAERSATRLTMRADKCWVCHGGGKRIRYVGRATAASC